MKYHFKVHNDVDGFWAECLEIKGCTTQAESKDELIINMKEALDLMMDEPEDSKILYPLPNAKYGDKRSVIEVEVDPNIAFAFLLRRSRIKKGFTQAQMKELLQFKSLFSYQKLEMSKYANPTLKSLKRIKDAIPDFPFRLLL